MNYEKLKEVALTRFNSFRKFSIAAGFSDVGLKETFMNRTMKVADLEKISKLLNVDPCDFIAGDGPDINKYNLENNPVNIRRVILEQETRISEYQERIQELKEKIDVKDKLIKILEEKTKGGSN